LKSGVVVYVHTLINQASRTQGTPRLLYECPSLHKSYTCTPPSQCPFAVHYPIRIGVCLLVWLFLPLWVDLARAVWPVQGRWTKARGDTVSGLSSSVSCFSVGDEPAIAAWAKGNWADVKRVQSHPCACPGANPGRFLAPSRLARGPRVCLPDRPVSQPPSLYGWNGSAPALQAVLNIFLASCKAARVASPLPLAATPGRLPKPSHKTT
jgi:hypothetical protein